MHRLDEIVGDQLFGHIIRHCENRAVPTELFGYPRPIETGFSRTLRHDLCQRALNVGLLHCGPIAPVLNVDNHDGAAPGYPHLSPRDLRLEDSTLQSQV